MEDSRNQQNIAKVVILSSVCTLAIIIAMAFISRDYLVSYVLEQADSTDFPFEQLLEEVRAEPVIDAVAEVNPAVVSVVITKDVPVYEQYYETYNPWGFFGGFSIPRVRENGTEEREVGGGSGFIVSQDGMIITNQHVVSDEEARYSVLLNDGVVYQVDVLARDVQLDIAVLKINEPLEAPLTVARFGDSSSLRLGQTVIAIGNALAEFQNSVSVGVVSGLSRSIVATDSLGREELLDRVIQTDAAINPGNSGGPLLNIKGEVVGVNVATSQGADNIGFAIPADVVKQVVDSVREYGEIVRPYMGVRYVMLTEQNAKNYDVAVDYGALIISGETANERAILQGSPAEKAGLQEGDIILSIDGEDLGEVGVATILRSRAVGDTVSLSVLRGDEQKTISLTLERAL